MENYEQEGYLNIARLISQKNDIQLTFQEKCSSTDGKTINIHSLYMNNRDKIYALLSHESGHIGYYSFINMLQKAKARVANRYHLSINTVHDMVNALEDCRIDLTNKKIFPGFYKMLVKLYKEIESNKKKGYVLRDFLGDLIYYVQDLGEFPYNSYKMNKYEEQKNLQRIKKIMNAGLSPSKTIVALNLLADLLSRNMDNIAKSGNLVSDDKKMSDNNVSRDITNYNKRKIAEKADDIADKVSQLSKKDIEKLAEDKIKKAEEEEKEAEDNEEEEDVDEEESNSKSGKGSKGKSDKEDDDEEGKGNGKKGSNGSSNEEDEEENNDELGDFDLDIDEDLELIELIDSEVGSESKVFVKKSLGEIEVEFKDFDEEVKDMVGDAILKITYSSRVKINEGTVRAVKEEPIDEAYMDVNPSLISTKKIISDHHILIKKLEGYFKTIKTRRNLRSQKSGRINNTVVRTVATNYDFDRCFTRKEIADQPKITLMIDISGSMGDRKLEAAKTSMVVLAESLKDVCNLRIVLFCGSYDALNVVVKDFGKPINHSYFDRFGHNHSYGSNIDGASVKYEALKNRSGIMIVVSDGQPAGSSYGLQEAAIDMNDARKLVKKIFAFSIEASGRHLDVLYPRNYTNVSTHNKMELTNKMLTFARQVVANLIR